MLNEEQSSPRARRCAGALTMIAAAVAMSACGDASNSSGGADSEGPVKIALLVPQLDNFYTQADIRGVEDVAKEEGAEVTVFNANFDPNAQAGQCLDAISTGYQAIVIQAVVGSSIVPCAQQAIEQDIAVVAIETPIGPDLATYEPQVEGIAGSVLADAQTDGTNAAEAIVRACGDISPCEVAQLIGLAGFSFDAARGEVIAEYLKDHPQIRIVSQSETHYQINEAIGATRDLLSAHPDVDVIETSADQMSVGATQVLSEAGKADVKIVSHGYSIEGADAVRAGEYASNGIMLPYTTGQQGAMIAIAHVRGEDLPDDERFFNPVTKFGPEGGVLYSDTTFDIEPEYSINRAG